MAHYDVSGSKRCTSSSDCNGDECGSDGICQCTEGRGGGDCSYEQCLGTVIVQKNNGNLSSAVDALRKDHHYPNNALCRFIVEPVDTAAQYVRFIFEYDLEETHDYISVRSGGGSYDGGAAVESYVAHRFLRKFDQFPV